MLTKAGSFDESRHPRQPGGGQGGGEFAPEGGGGGSGPSKPAAGQPAAPPAPVTPSKPASGHAATSNGQWREGGGLHAMVPAGQSFDQAVASGQPTHAASAPPDVHDAHDTAQLRSGTVGSEAEAQKVLSGIPLKGTKKGSGTLDDPVDVGDDIERAALLIAQGKHIRLNQPKEVSTLIDKIAEYVNKFKAQGKKAPTFDLCNVTVPGTNLFCTQSKNIPRAQMPQLSGFAVPGSQADKLPRTKEGGVDITEQFIKALGQMKVEVRETSVPASQLRATQNQLDGPKVAGIAKAMEAGKIPDAPIFVTRDNYVIDGHHRWAAKIATDLPDNKVGDVTMPVRVIDMDIGAAIDYTNAFAKSMGIQQVGIGAQVAGLGKKLHDVLVIVHKYSPDQPRVPSGGAGGGQFAPAGGGVAAPPKPAEPTPDTEAGVDPKGPKPWDMKAPAPSRYAGDNSIFSPALKDASGQYALGRRLQGTALYREPLNGKDYGPGTGPDAVAMHIFVPDASPADVGKYEGMIVAHSDHAQLHPGEIARMVNGKLVWTSGNNYYVRGNYRDLGVLAKELGPELIQRYGTDHTEVKFMTDATPGHTPIPVGQVVRHMRVVIPFAPGTPDNTVGDPSVSAATRDKIASLMSGSDGRIVVEHLDFNGVHLATDSNEDEVKRLTPQVVALGAQEEHAQHGPGGEHHVAGGFEHSVGATRFIPKALNVEDYPVKDMKAEVAGTKPPAVDHAHPDMLRMVQQREPAYQRLKEFVSDKLHGLGEAWTRPDANATPEQIAGRAQLIATAMAQMLRLDQTREPIHSPVVVMPPRGLDSGAHGVPTVPGMTDAKTAEDYLQRHWPAPFQAHLEGIDPATLEPVVSGLMSVANRYPEVAKGLASVEVVDLPREVATAIAATGRFPDGAHIALNRPAFQSKAHLQRLADMSYESGFSAQRDLPSIIVHEFGHVLSYDAAERGLTDDLMDYANTSALASSPVSKYAQTSGGEWIAETFAAAEGGSKHPDAQWMRDWLSQYYPGKSDKSYEPEQPRDEQGRWAADASPLNTWTGLKDWANSPDPVPALHEMHRQGTLPSILVGLDHTKQDPEWHPEGSTWAHSVLAVDQHNKIAQRDGIQGDDRRIGIITGLLHDVGKRTTTTVENGRVRAHKHAPVGAAMAREYLEHIGAPKEVVARVGNVIQHHMYHTNSEASPRTVARLQNHLAPATLAEWARQVEADTSARHPRPPANPAKAWTDIAARMKGVLVPLHQKFDPDQERDEAGRWTAGGAGGHDVRALSGEQAPNPHMVRMPMGKHRGGGERWVEQGSHLPGAQTPYDTPEIIALREANHGLPTTRELYSKNHAYTPERASQQQQIAQHVQQISSTTHGKDGKRVAHPVERKRQVWLVLGPPAAGKSSALAEPIARTNNARLIDSDDAKVPLKEFRDGKGAGQVHDESEHIVRSVMREAMNNGDNLVLPLVGRSLGHYEHAPNVNDYGRSVNEHGMIPGGGLRGRIEEFERHGYTVHIALLDLPEQEAQRRAVLRYYKTGRFVDPLYVHHVDALPSHNYEALRNEGRAGDFVAYSNDVKQGEPITFLPERSSKGQPALKAAQMKARQGPVSASYSLAWFV